MKVLLVHATAGAGHFKAAEGIFNALKEKVPREPFLEDVLDHTNPFHKKMYAGSYTFMVTYMPWLWGIFFKLVDLKILRGLILLARRIVNGTNGKKFEEYLERENFDVIVCTQFFSVEVASYLKKKKRISSRIVTVVTDYDVHSIWLASHVDQYCVATDFTKNRLMKMGVSQDKIHVTGIPVDPKFTQELDQKAVRKKLGLKENMFTVLIATGSFGIGPIEEIVDQLKNCQVVAICGHNKDLFLRLNKQKSEFFTPFGLVHNMDEMMAAADVMITKPGGLSVSEAMVKALPMIFFSAIPGQEQGNVRVLGESNVGISGLSIKEMIEHVNYLKSHPDEFLQARFRARDLGKPDAVERIVDVILSK